MKIEDLRPSPYNPRRISPEALDGLRASIRELGDVSGITFNKRLGTLATGHQRMEALKREFGDALRIEGTEEEPVIITPRGDRFHVRVVDWEAAKHRLALTVANSDQITGSWDSNISDLIGQIQVDFPDLSNEVRIDELLAGIREDMGNQEIPEGNKPIDEEELSETNTECPKCGFKWKQ